MKKSKGHIEFIGDYEYFTITNIHTTNLYRAPITNPVMPDGFRAGARFQAPSHMVDEWLEMLKEL